MSYNNGTVSEKKYKELGSVEREKKNYLQKVDIMNNRLKNLKQKQCELALKIQTMKKYENNRQSFQKFKETNQRELMYIRHKEEIDKKNQRDIVKKEKVNRSENLKCSMKKIQEEKKQKFIETKAEHLFTVSMLTQYNAHNYNLKKCKCIQQKLSKVKSDTNSEKKKLALKLKMELSELEKYEERYLKDLKKTTVFKSQLVKQFNRRLYEDNSRKANNSCGNIPIDKYNSYSYLNKKEMRTLSSTSSKEKKSNI